MDGNALKIPPNLEYPNATNQNSKQIVIKQDGKLLGSRFLRLRFLASDLYIIANVMVAFGTTFGNLMLQLLTFLTKSLNFVNLLKRSLIDPLLESPLKPQTKSKPFPIMYSRRHRHGPTPIIHPVQPSTVRLIYRKNDRRPRKDPIR